jgi:hypothetical protein
VLISSTPTSGIFPACCADTGSKMHSHGTTAAVSASGVGIAPAWEGKEKVRKTVDRPIAGASQLGRINSLLDRINSLFGHLGNLPGGAAKINHLAALVRSQTPPKPRISQYLPGVQGRAKRDTRAPQQR